MNTMVARAVGIEDMDPLLLVGFGESHEAEGRDFVFQCDLRVNDYPEQSNWPQGETYCVTDADGRTSFGGVLEAEFRGDVFRVLFDDRTVAVLRLPEPEWELHLQDGDADLPVVRRQLTRVLTCGRPEFRPRLLEIEGD
jgi:hypothetical protein